MRWLLFIVIAVAGCEERVPQAPVEIQNGEKTTPVALDPNRPQPPPPTAAEVSRSQERSPR